MFEYFLIFVKIRFINFARFGLQTAANLTLAKLNLINVNLHAETRAFKILNLIWLNLELCIKFNLSC